MPPSYRQEADETDRLLTLTDGVIAIVITLLVLDITVPAVPPGKSASVLADLVVAQWPEFFGFALSFLVIGLYWALHRRTFVHIERHERGVVFLNLLFLLAVGFVPYATSVFTTYPNTFGVAFLAAVLALTGLTLALVWIYASRREVVESGLRSRTVRIQTMRFLASPLIFVVSILVAVLLGPAAAILTWLLLIPANGALQSRLVESLEETPESESESRARGPE
jgi:uncharacterized membrane protein